ncbi:hypothetical protein VTO73DRAFT_4556 [Trametes versicolor]
MLRALRIIGEYIVLMRTYHKMRAASGLDRVIPHALNVALAAVFIYKEAICRPFAQLCASVLFPGDQKVKSLYQDFLFVNYDRPFDGEDITKEMRVWTQAYLGIELGISKWRQCSTPFRRKHAGLEEMWLEDQDTVDSAQAGHSHSVDTTRYGVTNWSATGLAEDYIGPFLKTSVLWQKVLGLVPGGNRLSLEDAARVNFKPEPAHLPIAAPAGLDVQAVVQAAVQAVRDELEPRLTAIEQRIQDTSASTKQELQGMFADLKTFLAGASVPGPMAGPSAQVQAPAPRPPRSPSPEDRTEGMYRDDPSPGPAHIPVPAHVAPIPRPQVPIPLPKPETSPPLPLFSTGRIPGSHAHAVHHVNSIPVGPDPGWPHACITADFCRHPCLSYNLLRLLDILRLSMVIELNISEWDDLPDLETVSGSDDEWEIEGVLGGGRTEVQERSAAETEAAGTLRLNSKSTTAASSAVLGYTLLPSTLGSTLPDIDIDARNGRVNLRPLDGHTIRAEPAAHGPSSVATAGPVLADMQHVPQVSAEVIKALCSDFASIRLETRTRIRENGHDENMGDADWSPPLMLDGFQGHYSDRSKNSAVDDLAEGRRTGHDVRQRQHQLWRPNGHGCQPRKLADRVKDVIASVATLTQGIQSRVIDDIGQLVGKPHIAIAAARLSQLCLPPSAVSPLSPAPYPLRFLDRRTMARTTQTARKSANPKGPPKKPLPAPPKKTRASTSTLAAAAPPPPVKTAPRSIPSHRSARVVAAEEAEVVQEGEQPYLEEDDEVDELLQDDDAVYDAALNDDAVFNVDENGNPMEDDDQLMEDDDQLMEDDDAPMEDDDAPMDDYDESTEDLEGQPLQAIHGAAESPKRHSSRPKRQPTPTTSEDEAEGEPEGEDTLMDVEINATEDEYGAAQLAEAIAGILRPAPQPEEGGLLPGGDRPMERSLRALFDNIGEGTDAFGEDTAVLAATLRNGPPRMRASSAKGKGKGKDKDNVEEVSVFDEGLDHAEIVARLQVIGVPGRGLAADEETKRLYKERQAALLGYGIVDLCDPEFLSYAIWGQYNSRTTNPNTVLALAQDFKTAGKRHWEHPLEGALDSSWVDRKTLTKDLSSLDKIPFLKLNYKAMGQHAMTFFSGAHRKVACWVCCMAATTTLESIDTEIEVGIEEGVTEDDPSMKTLRTMRDNVEKELESSGWWLVRVSNLGKVTENLAHKLSENNELQEEKMRVEERLFIWLRDIRQRVQEWRLSHPGEETPSVDSNQWRELFINPAIAHNERKGQSAVWILSSPVAYAFLQRMSTYDYFRAEGTISHNELKARLMPASRAKTEIQTVGYMWHDIAISGLNQMDFIARTTEFGTWRDDGECGEIYKSYFQLIEDGAEASWTSEDCAEIKHKFEEAVSLAATKGRLVARMWPRELLNAIDKLYVEHVAPVMGRMGTSQWDAAMHVYNKALVVTCQAVWGLPVFVEGDAQLAQSSAYALDKLLVCRRLCKTGVYLNVPLPTRSFLDESYKRLENVEYAIRWMTRTLDPRVDAVARQVGRGYIDYSHYLLYLLCDPERFPHRPGFDIALPLWGFVLKNYELLKVVEDVVWLNLARADDLFSFSPNSYRTLGEKLAKEGAAHPMPTEFATLYPGGWNNKISQLLALGRSKIAEAISNKPPAVIAYISTSEYHARLAGVAPPPPPTVRKPDTHEEVRVKIGYEEFSPALLKETPLLAALRFTDPRWCADAQQGSNKPKWLGAIVLHINTILDIMRRWAGDVYSNPCVQLLRIKLFQFLSLHSAAKTPWKNWDSGLLGELSGIDNLDPEDTDMLAAAIKAIDAVPDVPLHVNAHGRRARGAQGIARTAADAEVSQPDDEIVFLRMEGAVDVETRRLKYKTEASRLVTSIRRMTSASAGPAQPKAIDARVVNAMQELLNALYYNVNRIEYRYSVGDIQSERPWVLPSAPFAHTLDTPALLGVVDNNAFLDLGDFKTRLPTAYTQYSAAAQGSRRNKIPPPSISQLKDGALVQTTRAWLPQDFSWDLSLKGSPSISVKMEDMDDDAVILGVPRAQSTNSAPDLMDDTEDGDLDLINNEMQDGQPERIPASAKGKAREVPAPPMKSTPVARPRAAAPRKPAKNPPAVNPPPSTKARTPKAATAPIQNQPPPALARARSAKAVVTAPAPEPVQAGNTLPVPPQRERVTRSSTTSAKGNTGPLSAAPAPVASSAKRTARTQDRAKDSILLSHSPFPRAIARQPLRVSRRDIHRRKAVEWTFLTLVLLQESPATLISSYLCDFFTENYDLGLGVKRRQIFTKSRAKGFVQKILTAKQATKPWMDEALNMVNAAQKAAPPPTQTFDGVVVPTLSQVHNQSGKRPRAPTVTSPSQAPRAAKFLKPAMRSAVHYEDEHIFGPVATTSAAPSGGTRKKAASAIPNGPPPRAGTSKKPPAAPIHPSVKSIPPAKVHGASTSSQPMA